MSLCACMAVVSGIFVELVVVAGACRYGGAGVAEQIADLKRGAEV